MSQNVRQRRPCVDSGRYSRNSFGIASGPGAFAGRRLVACGGVMVLCEIVVYCGLMCGCVGFGVGVRVRVEWVLLWRRWDVARVLR